MPYTQREREQIIREVCPHCAQDNEPRFRSDSREWIHDLGTKSADGKTEYFKQTICRASNFRQGNLSGGMDGR